jgi:hypothetical protein
MVTCSPSPAKDDGMFADDRAAAQRGKTDGAGNAHAGMAVAHAHGMFSKIDLPAPGSRFTEQQCRARRRIDLVLVVHFEDFDVPAPARARAPPARQHARRLTPRLILPDLTMRAWRPQPP